MAREKIKRRKSSVKRGKGSKVVKSGRRNVDEVKRLRWLLIGLAVILTGIVAAVGYWIWSSLPESLFSQHSNLSSVTGSAPEDWDGKTLPVYPDSFNLVLVNAANELPGDFTVHLAKVDGVEVEERIVQALQGMIKDAKSQGIQLKLVSGYVSREDQEAEYQNKVQDLMRQFGYSRVKAEDEALHLVGRGGYSEYQTGMAVNFSKEGMSGNGDFSKTEEYRWLLRNSITYGFVQRNPENKTSTTGMVFEPGHFRYVGVSHAKTMRQLEMCLEEYTTYLYRQAHW